MAARDSMLDLDELKDSLLAKREGAAEKAVKAEKERVAALEVLRL